MMSFHSESSSATIIIIARTRTGKIQELEVMLKCVVRYFFVFLIFNSSLVTLGWCL